MLTGPAAAEPVKDVVASVLVSTELAFPESMTSDEAGRLIFSGPGTGIIYRSSDGQAATPWILDNKGRSVFGVLADASRQTLWVCAATFAPIKPAQAPSATSTQIRAYDLATGAFEAAIPLTGEGALCNDFAFGPAGDLYVTDYGQGAIWRLSPGGEFSIYARDPKLKGADGLAFGQGGVLYVDTYKAGGLLRLTSGEGGVLIQNVQLDLPLTAPDGMRADSEGVLYLVEGTRLDRIVVQGLNGHVEPLRSDFDAPTALILAGKRAWVLDGKVAFAFNPAFRTKAAPFRAYLTSIDGADRRSPGRWRRTRPAATRPVTPNF